MRVGLFITCFNDALFPGTGSAVVTLLERLGHEVTFEPAQTCCGQLHWTTGYHREAAALARRFADVCERLLSENDLVVTPSASCAAMVRESYPRLLPDLAAAPADGDGPPARGWRDCMPRRRRSDAGRYEAALRQTMRWARLLARGGRIRRLPGLLGKWTDARDLPAPPKETFRAWWRARDGASARARRHWTGPGPRAPG